MVFVSNVPEAVYMQHLMGIEGVIVDLVQEITKAVSDLKIRPLISEEGREEGGFVREEIQQQVKKELQFSQQELSFLLKLIPELIRT